MLQLKQSVVDNEVTYDQWQLRLTASVCTSGQHFEQLYFFVLVDLIFRRL